MRSESQLKYRIEVIQQLAEWKTRNKGTAEQIGAAEDSWMQLSPLTGCEAEAVLLKLLYPQAISGGSDVESDPTN